MEHVRAELENSNGNVNSIWKVLNRCLPRKDQPLSTTEDHFSQANKFNQFYTSVGLSAASRAKTVAEEHNFYTFNQESNCCPINDSPQDVQCPLFEFQSVTEEEVGKIIRSLPSNKAPGLDKVTARVLKDSLPTTLSAITNLVNTSFSSNTFAHLLNQVMLTSLPTHVQYLFCLLCPKSAKGQRIRSLLSFWIKMEKLPSYKMETGNFIQLKLLHLYFISLMKFLRIWLTKRYL